ncbi:MAG: 16S rRNA (cytosine(1402)-N(4))-methyltransferase RsmH [Candidatus Omnitrophica bacterium]|nr:16S rRNA (cytosine(1402)-N(4))-methyltransferase RsmH [Candidatus Omnitrophota bacterium]
MFESGLLPRLRRDVAGWASPLGAPCVEEIVETKLHTPVMLGEILEYLDLAPGKTVVDATVGTAGHALEVLKKITPGGRLIGIDRDEDALAIARHQLEHYGKNSRLVYGSFADIDNILKDCGIRKVDGILFDLGVSSLQLGDPERGFSFNKDGPLDMRMDKKSYISAYDLMNNLNEQEISTILWNFGQERWHRRIARLLVREREKHPITTTSQLSDIVFRAMPYKHKYQRIHPATRTFQAVRIAVNRELESLESAITKSVDLLAKGGRICVISFHSLEDRIVKWRFREFASNGLVRIITPKPLTPSWGEAKENPSSRSSKLRVAERL